MNNPNILTCPFCGHEFDAGENAACQTCPMHRGCSLVCCPACGYQMADARRSLVGRLAGSIFHPKHHRRKRERHGLTLSDVPPGRRAKVVGFRDGIPYTRRAHLQAYGLVPNDWVVVLQHSPVTVIQIDQTELALENSLANEIEVETTHKGENNEDRQ
jgi:Fe2+ transport system protein FeoA